MSVELFRAKAPNIMELLIADFGLSIDDSAAILGNIGHECNGFSTMQEVKPLIPGSRGGFGYCQWTGPRRRDFEAYCKRNSLDPYSDKANYGFLFVELKGAEGKRALPALKAAKNLRDKVIAFEGKFLRAGIKHYDSRYIWAQRAKEAYEARNRALPPKPAPKHRSPVKEIITTIGVGTGTGTIAKQTGWDWSDAVGFALAVAIIVGVGLFVWRKVKS